MVQNLIVESMTAIPSQSHPSGCTASIHPNYRLLGFSAALAPKFHPEMPEAEGAVVSWRPKEGPGRPTEQGHTASPLGKPLNCVTEPQKPNG